MCHHPLLPKVAMLQIAGLICAAGLMWIPKQISAQDTGANRPANANVVVKPTPAANLNATTPVSPASGTVSTTTTSTATGPVPSPSLAPSGLPAVTATGVTVAATNEATPKVTLRVTKAYRDDPKDKEHKRDSGLYDHIIVEVENLALWAKQRGNDPAQFILYLDGKPLKGLVPEIDQYDQNKLHYTLMRTPESRDEWNALLGRPSFRFHRPVRVTVGLENQPPEPSVATMEFTLINKYGFFVYLGIVLSALAIFWTYARSSGILQDPNTAVAKDLRPYSLGRCQMAFWFFLVAGSYVFIWMVTSDYGSLTASVLGLIGISAGTALGAAVVDSSKRDDAVKKRDELEAQKAQLQTDIKANAVASDTALKKDELAQVEQKIESLTKLANPVTKGKFIDDLLKDPDKTVSFHRLQIVVWTIVLGVIFVVSVYNVLAMPDFPGTLLALMGISSGTYIGFKLPDQKS